MKFPFNFCTQTDYLAKISTHKEIYDLYKIKPPKPEFISFHLWGEGLHVWKPGYKMDDMYTKIIQPDEKVSIYICISKLL